MLVEPNLFFGTLGPRNAEVVVVGEAWGAEEARLQLPFQGFSGKELHKMLLEAGIDTSRCFFTNVVSARPPGNDMRSFLHPITSKVPPVKGLHPQPIVLDGVEKLKKQIAVIKPKLIIACGNFPLWALTDKAQIATGEGFKLPAGITKWRGSQLRTEDNIPLLPVIHPAAILRSWENRHITVHDLRFRAGRFLKGELSWDEPSHTFISQPSATEVISQLTAWITEAKASRIELAVDIETYKRKEIACIGIANSKLAMCIPFFYYDEQGRYHDVYTEEEESTIVQLLRILLMCKTSYIIGQNFVYDYQFLERTWGIRPHVDFDTMLAQHVMWPGTPKSLDYLASIYCDSYVYWKDESQDWDAQSSHRDMWLYNCKDVRATYSIAQAQRSALEQLNLVSQYEWKLEEWRLAVNMMARGVRVDEQRKRNLRVELFKAASEIEQWLFEAMPPDIRVAPSGTYWYNSPRHQQFIFYECLGLRPVLHKKTKRPTLSADALAPLAKQAPWLKPVWERLELLRSISVFSSHFLDINLSPDRRLRCNFNVGGPETFRWSSSANGFGEGTNLQNIPKGDEDE